MYYQSISRKTEQRIKKLKQRLLIFTFTIIICICFLFTGIMTSAHDSNVDQSEHIIYRTIQIKSGDSLWSIADKYKPETQTIKEYIQELKDINGLKYNTIQADRTFTISCYE